MHPSTCFHTSKPVLTKPTRMVAPEIDARAIEELLKESRRLRAVAARCRMLVENLSGRSA